MFELNGKLSRLDISASKVLRLQRSLSDVQIALPGQHSQVATAYICAFSAGKGARVAIGFHLKDDFKVVYYLNADGEISSGNAVSVLNQAIDFCETLGFMMNDVDIHKLGSEEKSSFWESVPLKNPPVKPQPPSAPKAVEKTARSAANTETVEEAEELSAAESIELDLGLPRRRLATSLKKERPSPAELEKKRGRLRENLGRFLSSL